MLPIASGVLSALAFPPFDLGPLVIVAPLPLLWLWLTPTGPRRAALDGFVAGAVFFGVLVVWAWHFGVVAYFPLVGVLAASWAAAGALAGTLSARGLRSPWAVASAWVLLEGLRARWPLGGFSWGELGYATHDIPVLRSLAAWGGVTLVSFVIVALAGLVVRELHQRGRGWVGAIPRMGAMVALAALLVVTAHLLLPRTSPGGALRIAVVQGNDLNRPLTASEVGERYLPRSHFELAGSLDDDVDLVVLPESSLDEDPRHDQFLAEGLENLARRVDGAVLANASVETDGGERLLNTNFLFDGTGLVDTYVKQHLVPFGEYVPGRSLLGFLDEIEQIPRDYVPGDEPAVFTVAGVSFGNLICFESAFTEIARGYARDGAEVLVVSTNNRSFRRSGNSSQHLAMGQIRAIETGRPLVHAGISGKSAFVEPDGDVVMETDLFERTTIAHSVTGHRGRTPYVLLGDWVLLAAGAVLVGAAWRVRRGQFAQGGDRS